MDADVATSEILPSPSGPLERLSFVQSVSRFVCESFQNAEGKYIARASEDAGIDDENGRIGR